MWVLGARMDLVWRGSSKIIFLSFFTKHKVVSVNYSLILTIFFLFFNGIWPLQGQWTTFNDLYMKQSTEQWAWKIVILTFIIRPVSASINWCLTIYQSAPSDVRSSSSGSAIAQFNFCLLSVNGPTIYCCAPVKCAMVVCRPVSMLALFFSLNLEAYWKVAGVGSSVHDIEPTSCFFFSFVLN